MSRSWKVAICDRLPEVSVILGSITSPVLARGDDPPEPPALLARGDDPPEPPALLARGDDPPEPPAGGAPSTSSEPPSLDHRTVPPRPGGSAPSTSRTRSAGTWTGSASAAASATHT